MPQPDPRMSPSPQSTGLQRQRIKPVKSLEGFWRVPPQKSQSKSLVKVVPHPIAPQPQVSGAQAQRAAPGRPAVLSRQASGTPKAAAMVPPVQPTAGVQPQRAVAVAPQAKTKRSRLRWLLMPLYAILAMAGGLLVQSLIVGQILLAVYALFAWVRKVPSGTTFLIALITFGATVLFFTLHQNGQQAQNFAVYTFWIVVIGTISMILEIRRDKKIRRLRNRDAQRI